MFTPKNYQEVIRGYKLRRNILLLLNTFLVLAIILIFMWSFSPGVTERLFVISYPVYLFPVVLITEFAILSRVLSGPVMFLLLSWKGRRVDPSKPEEVFGKYRSAEILEMVRELEKKMDVGYVRHVFVYEGNMSNAMTTDIILLKPYRSSMIVLTSSLVETLNRDELMAALGHEMAHLKRNDVFYNNAVIGPSLMLIWIILILIQNLPEHLNAEPVIASLLVLLPLSVITRPIAKSMARYSEYAADFLSAEANGLLPMANALIKIGQRDDTILGIYYTLQKRYRLDAGVLSGGEFRKELEESLKGVIDPDKAEEITRELVRNYGGSERKRRGELPLLKPKILDWREFDSHIKDYSLDYVELGQLVEALKRGPHLRLFRHVSSSYTFSVFGSHPRFKERIIFLWDAFSKNEEERIYTVMVSRSAAPSPSSDVYVCPFCQVKFRLVPTADGPDEVVCPNCGLKGEV
ncbi:MAG: hypothetical protein DRN35_06230 [Thermoplasmata archaeon]|nr:MAG: hypothetical protein DRN35_06230 [Thermoplasmata archaeon]RLF72372.1 MAG: hypothetical protein DRN40_00380 [Thermoplasmata archaeon]RLF74267.1 MAG: hypothetical protein DRN55_00665 [Thermoplasmata archaeon]HDD59935.1 hypothetical protein [Euryarchaeota archaeon]